MKTYKDKNILLVDDDEDLRESLQDLIEIFVGKVYLAEHGKDGLDVYEKNQNDIDLVVTDCQMPVMRGYDFIEELVQRYGDVDILIMSGEKSHEGKIPEHICGELCKPFEINDLIYYMNAIFDNEKHFKCIECDHWNTKNSKCSNIDAMSYRIERDNEEVFGCALNSNRTEE